MSIRLRLTLIYSGILALALIGFSLLSYVAVARDGLAVQTNTLAIKARRLTTAPTFALADIDQLAAQIAGPEVYLQTRNAAGAVVDQTANLARQTLPLTRIDLSNVNPNQPWSDIAAVGADRLLIYNQPVVAQGQISGVLQIANSLLERERSLLRFRNILLLGDTLILAGALGIGWAVAGLGLRPIQRLTETARQIGLQRDFSQRVAHLRTKDEVGQLASTFNEMLAALQDAYVKSEETLKQQRRFVADASHELRTPLTTIRGNLGLLQRTPPIDAADRHSVVQDLVDETGRLIRLVNDLLVLARHDAGQPLLCTQFPIKPVLEDVYRQIRLLAPERTITLGPVPDELAQGNRDALKQVLVILLDNALKHTTPAAAIALSAASEQQQVQIAVCDTGPGIATDQLPHLFERFYQVDATRHKQGAGLGLAIAKTLVEAQGGLLQVTSQSGVGSTFTVTLPR